MVEKSISHLIDQSCVSVSPTESVSVTVRRVAGLVRRPKIGHVASIQNTQLINKHALLISTRLQRVLSREPMR